MGTLVFYFYFNLEDISFHEVDAKKRSSLAKSLYAIGRIVWVGFISIE